MSDTFYFSHDYNTRSDKKVKKLIAKHGFTGYGVFWAIIEDLYNNDNRLDYDLELLAFDLRVEEDFVKSIIEDFDLFVVEGEFFYSNSIEKRIQKRAERSEKARENANKRWGNKEIEESEDGEETNGNATAMQPHSNNDATAMPNDAILKDIKGKDIKGKSNSSNSTKSGFILRVRKGKSKKPSDFEIDIGVLERIKGRFPDVTDEIIKQEITKMELWTEEKPVSRLPTDKGITRFITNWLLKRITDDKNGIGKKNGTHKSTIEEYRADRAAYINGK